MVDASAVEPCGPLPANELTGAQLRAGMEAFFNIAGLWKIKNDEAIVLLGRPSRRTFFNWKNGKVSRVPDDTVRRISYIVGIYKALQILYSRPAMADDWVKRSNGFFGGQSPLRRMLAGDVADLFVVRQYLDSARGGWA